MRSLAVGYPRGTQLPEHRHRWHQLVYAVAGVLSVSTTEGSWITPPHWALWVPAGVLHALRFAGAASLRTLYFPPSPTGRRRSGSAEFPARCVVLEVSPLLRELIVRTCDLGSLDGRESEHRALATLLQHSLLARPTPPFDLPQPTSPDLRRLAAHLEMHPATQETAAELAARCGWGLRTLERRFRQECGLTIDHWRRRARMAHALRQLAEGTSVKMVAGDCGYRTASAFVAAFRDVFGTTPGRYFARR